jgi:hypothetical protein
MTYYLRTEESPDAAAAALRRGRSVNGWSHVGLSPLDWAYGVCETTEQDLAYRLADCLDVDVMDVRLGADGITTLRDTVDPDALDAAIIEELELEPTDDGKGYWRPLPGLCALASSDSDLGDDAEAWLALVPDQDGLGPDGLFQYLAVYEGRYAGVDDAGWDLFTPVRLVRVMANPRWDGHTERVYG